MDLKALKWQMIRGVLARRTIIGCLCFVLAMVIVSFTRMAYEVQINEPVLVNLDQCSLVVGLGLSENSRMKISNLGGKNLTSSVVKELVNKKMLRFDDRALCVGEGSDSDVLTLREVGFNEVVGVYESVVSSVDFQTNYFDFVLSRTVDRVPIPALLVLEIERVLRPGGIGAMLVGFSAFNMGSLVRSATPVSLLLRTSEILHVCGIGSFALIVFKKKLNNVVYFEDYKLPSECPSISRNKPFMERIEGIMDQNMLSYLPEFVNVSTRNKLIYINMGTGELGNDYPIHLHAFNVYVVDHNVSALSANVKKPGVTFVYHPGLVERHDNFGPRVNHVDYFEAPLHEQRFEFIDWFKETAEDGDFVVLKMNAGLTQLKVLFELFESGAICHVDEMFVRCSEGVDCGNRLCSDCFSLYNGLRNAGVFVHRWSGD